MKILLSSTFIQLFQALSKIPYCDSPGPVLAYGICVLCLSSLVSHLENKDKKLYSK